jgi:hypothetical protein
MSSTLPLFELAVKSNCGGMGSDLRMRCDSVAR